MEQKYIIVSGNDFNEARKKIRESNSSGRKVIFAGMNDELARKVMEKEQISILLISLEGRKDRLKQRNSGLNQVLAKIAKKKDVTIGINIDELLNSGKEEKAEILARIAQNIKLCNKSKLNMVFVSKQAQDAYNLNALGITLGMPTWMSEGLLVVK